MTTPPAIHPALPASATTSVCPRCGVAFSCASAESTGEPCWCTALPAAVPLPQEGAACWCRACLVAHIAQLSSAQGRLK